MSESFRGLKQIRKIAKRVSNQSGVGINISTISAEPTSYSNGQFPIIRGFWEKELIRLFDSYAPKRDNSWREYGVDFENETFHVHIDYQDADCSCDYKKQEDAWLAENWHKRNCFRSIIDPQQKQLYKPVAVISKSVGKLGVFFQEVSTATVKRMCGQEPSVDDIKEEKLATEKHEHGLAAWRKAHAEYERQLKKLVKRVAAEMKLDFSKYGWEIEWNYACTCGQREAHEEWQRSHAHAKPCEIWWFDQPNFLHKTTGYAVHWYKYPCREAYGNQSMSPKEFKRLISECIKSVKTAT